LSIHTNNQIQTLSPAAKPLVFRQFGPAALSLLLCYLGIAFCMSGPTYFSHPTPLIPLWSFIHFPSNSVLTGILALLFLLIFLIYANTYFSVWRHRKQMQSRNALFLLIGSTLLFGIPLVCQARVVSTNPFTDLFAGQLIAHYQSSPWTSPSAQYSTNPYVQWITANPTNPDLISPGWAAYTTLLAAISTTPLLSLLLLKGSMLAVHLMNSVLIWCIQGKLQTRHRLATTLLYAWNPLLLIESAGNGQSITLALSFLLLATWFTVLRTPPIDTNKQTDTQTQIYIILIPITLGLAASIQPLLFFVAPFYLWHKLHTNTNSRFKLVGYTILWQTLLLILPIMLFTIPLWRTTQTYFQLVQAFTPMPIIGMPLMLIAAPLQALYQHLAPANLPTAIKPGASAELTAQAASIVLFLTIYGSRLLSFQKSSDVTHEETNQSTASIKIMLRNSAISLTAANIFLPTTFQPWLIVSLLWAYLLWDRKPEQSNAPFIPVILLTGTTLYYYLTLNAPPLVVYQTLFIFGLPLASFLIINRKDRRERAIYNRDGRS